MINTVLKGDCLELMKDIPDKSIDMILCDLPYGTTACKWDTIIPFEPLWEQYKRIIKDNGAIVLTASQPFTSALVMSNPKAYKHHWIWKKERGTGFQVAKYRPMMQTEDIIGFSFGKIPYSPIKIPREKPRKMQYAGKPSLSNPLANYNKKDYISNDRFPVNILEFARERNGHPTQKPVALFEYLIKTYTNEGDTILDNCAGSFTTAIAAENTKRNWICIEQLEEYCEIGKKRINENRVRLGILDNCDIIK